MSLGGILLVPRPRYEEGASLSDGWEERSEEPLVECAEELPELPPEECSEERSDEPPKRCTGRSKRPPRGWNSLGTKRSTSTWFS